MENAWRGGGVFLCFQPVHVVFHDPDGREIASNVLNVTRNSVKQMRQSSNSSTYINIRSLLTGQVVLLTLLWLLFGQ